MTAETPKKSQFVRELLGRSDYAIIGEIVEPKTKVLDLGCGEGELLAWLAANKDVEGRGVEISGARVSRAISRGVSVYQCDIDQGLADYPDQAFDYVILSQTLPTSYSVIATIVTFEKLGWGIGCVGHMIYMMQQLAPGPFKMTHYAFATGVMALTKLSTGWMSGKIFPYFGHSYPKFFTFVLIASIPPLIFAWFAPFREHNETCPTAGTGH